MFSYCFCEIGCKGEQQEIACDQPNVENHFICSIIAIIIILIMVFSGAGKGLSAREKTIKVITLYIEKGEYDRALNLVEQLLLTNPDDKEAQDLQDKILNAKRGKEQLTDEERARLEKEKQQQEKDQLDKLIETVEKSGNKNPVVNIKLPETEKTKEPKAVATESKDTKAKKIQDLLAKGEEQRTKQKYKDALDTFNEVLKLDADSAEAFSRIGRTYFEESPENDDNIKKAIEFSRKAIDKDPTLAKPHKTLAEIYDSQNNYETAEHEYKQTLLLDPQDWDSLFKMGVIQYKLKRYTDARQSFENCLKIKKDFAKANFNRGLCCVKLNDDNCAIDAYQKAITYDAGLYQAYNELGVLYSKRGETSSAITNFTKAISLAPNDARYHRNLADVYITKGNIKEAENELTTAIKIDAKNAESNYKLGSVKYLLGKYEEGLPFADSAVQSNPDNEQYNYQLGLIYEALNNTDKAIKYYLAATRINAKYAKPLINLGKIYTDIGSFDTALQLLAAAYKLEPENYIVNNNLGNAYLAKELYADAVKHLEKAVLLQPNVTKTRFNLGYAYKKIGKIKEAKAAFSELLKLDTGYWDAYYEYALILIAEDDKKSAKTLLDTLIAKKPDYSKRSEVDGLLRNL